MLIIIIRYMYSYQGAPVHNPGYFDVPICNQYSNKNVRDPNENLTEYQLNTKINLTNNDNMANYTVYQQPTHPSPSLYYETNQPMNGNYYVNPNQFLKKNALIKKKEYPSFYDDYGPQDLMEKFSNLQDIYDGPEFASARVNGGSIPQNTYVNHANRDYSQYNVYPNSYLNLQSMPNISSFYMNNPYMQNPNIIQPQVQRREPMPQIMYQQPPVVKEVVTETVKIEDLPVKKRKSKREKEDKKSTASTLFYITIILLIVVVILLLIKSIIRK